MKKSLTFITSFVMAGFLFAQDCEPYFPMDEGTQFEITDYDKKDKITGKVKHTVLTKTDEGSGNLTCTVQQESFDNKDEPVYTSQYTVHCVDGVFNIDMSVFMDSEQMSGYSEMDTDVDATNLEMPTNPVVGQELGDGTLTVKIGSGGVTMFTMTVNVTNRKVDAIEEVTTDAGTFECVKITYDVSTKMLVKIERSVAEWYSPNVGVVKTETYKKDKLESYSLLTSFNN